MNGDLAITIIVVTIVLAKTLIRILEILNKTKILKEENEKDKRMIEHIQANNKYLLELESIKLNYNKRPIFPNNKKIQIDNHE